MGETTSISSGEQNPLHPTNSDPPIHEVTSNRKPDSTSAGLPSRNSDKPRTNLVNCNWQFCGGIRQLYAHSKLRQGD